MFIGLFCGSLQTVSHPLLLRYPCTGLSIKFNGKKLQPVEQVKYLGMCLDKHLSWEYHINKLSKKLSRANGILAKLRHNAPINTCLQVYYAIFYSHVIYGSAMWD